MNKIYQLIHTLCISIIIVACTLMETIIVPASNPSILIYKPMPIINSSAEFKQATEHQFMNLNSSYFLYINSSINIMDEMNRMKNCIVAYHNQFQYPVDKNGNQITTNFTIHKFTMEYRDDFKVLRAFENNQLIAKLTPEEKLLKEKAEKILVVVEPSMSDYEKVRAIHDYIILNGTYETSMDDALVNETLQKTAGLLLYGMGNYASYTGSMYLLLNMAGIECIYVTGFTRNNSGIVEAHAWNKAKIDGEWYNFDAAWNSLSQEKQEQTEYKYFGLSDKSLSTTHFWNYERYPQKAVQDLSLRNGNN